MQEQTILGNSSTANLSNPKSKRATHKIDKCPECGSVNLIFDHDTGENVCGDCGLVLSTQLLDKGPDWRAFTPEQKATRSRVGPPKTLSSYDSGLSTAIEQIDHDAFGRKLPLSTRLQMWRLTKWQKRIRIQLPGEKNLAQAMPELDRLSDSLDIPPSTREEAARIYREAVKKRLNRYGSINVFIAAALYAACRQHKIPRVLHQIAQASQEGIDRVVKARKKEIARCYRILLKELKISVPIEDPLSWVSKISETVEISGETQGRAYRIICDAKAKKIPLGRSPRGIAAAALWIACKQNNEPKNQKRIAEAADVTAVTLRDRAKSLKEGLNLQVPDF